MKVGVEKLIKIIRKADDLVESGEKVLSDGTIGLGDVQYLPKIVSDAKELYEAAKDLKAVLEEIKDLDVAEGAILFGELKEALQD